MFNPLGQVLRYEKLHVPSIPKTPESDATREKTESTALSLLEGILKSKVTRALVITGAVVAAPFLLASNPVGWVATALGVSLAAAVAIFACAAIAIFGLCLLAQQLFCDGTLEFEAVAPYRLMKDKDYDTIAFSQWKRPEGAPALILGSLPNRLGFSAEKTLKGNGAVLSINETWEREALGFSVPYSPKAWKELGVDYLSIDVKDHTLLSIEEMDQAADWIRSQLEAGKHTYVHCLGGVGRSATAIAAYLMKHGRDENDQPLTLEAICLGIKGSRKKSTIWNKLQALRDYDNYLVSVGVQRPEHSNEIKVLIEKLDAGAKKLKKAEIAPLTS